MPARARGNHRGSRSPRNDDAFRLPALGAVEAASRGRHRRGAAPERCGMTHPLHAANGRHVVGIGGAPLPRPPSTMAAADINLVSGRQLRAARVLAGLTQAQLAEQLGCHERACRYWEAKGDDRPTSTTSILQKIEAALLANSVVVFCEPSPGARLSQRFRGSQELPINGK
jgi:DNA-binding transcriptional regulator YiaG